MSVPRDLPDLLGRLVRRAPERPVVVDRCADGTSVTVTRAQLWQRVAVLAEELGSIGIRPGDAVAVWLPNWSDTLVWQFAAAAVGAHVIGVNTRYNVDEVRHVLHRARPVVVALATGFHGLDLPDRLRAALRTAAGTAAPVPVVAVVAGPGGAAPSRAELDAADVGGGVWAPATAAGAAARHGAGAVPPSDADVLVVAFTTSGSTGLPKLAAHRATGVLVHAVADAAVLGIHDGDAVLCALPLSGVFGYNLAMAALAAGGVCVLEPVFDADTVLDDMAAHRITHVASGDDLMLRLVEAATARPRDLSAWRWWGVADFQGRATELARWVEATVGATVTGLYGSSEVFALTALWPADVPAPRRWRGGGRLVHAGLEVRVTDPANGRIRPQGTEGELQFRGPEVVDAYLGDDTAAARSFTADGWFRSGDLGVLVDGRTFEYVVRMGDALRLRGFLVDPAEIELRLAAHPDVATARVVGIPGHDGGTVAVGFVVAAPGRRPVPAALRTWCAEGLAAFKVPVAVHVVDTMPTTSGTNGTKIRATTLREWALARQRSAGGS